MVDPRYASRYQVVLDQVLDEWRSHADVVDSVKKRVHVSTEALWTRLRRLEADGVIERRGTRGSYEWRRVPSSA